MSKYRRIPVRRQRRFYQNVRLVAVYDTPELREVQRRWREYVAKQDARR